MSDGSAVMPTIQPKRWTACCIIFSFLSFVLIHQQHFLPSCHRHAIDACHHEKHVVVVQKDDATTAHAEQTAEQKAAA